MPRSQIDEKSVFALCDRIYVETGRDPTYEDVTSELGGSNSTVKPYLHSWIDKARPMRHPLPEALAAKAGSLVQAIWGYALTDASQTTLAKQREFGAELDLCRKQLGIAVAEIAAIEEDRTRLKTDIDVLIAERAELKVRLHSVDAMQAQIQRGEALVESLRSERDEARLLASGACGQVEALERQLAAARMTRQTQGQSRPRKPAKRPSAKPAGLHGPPQRPVS